MVSKFWLEFVDAIKNTFYELFIAIGTLYPYKIHQIKVIVNTFRHTYFCFIVEYLASHLFWKYIRIVIHLNTIIVKQGIAVEMPLW